MIVNFFFDMSISWCLEVFFDAFSVFEYSLNSVIYNIALPSKQPCNGALKDLYLKVCSYFKYS